jgi:hypothetical protein
VAKTKAKKLREKQVREGKMDVTIRRGSWGELNPCSRQTKSKKEALIRMEKKHRKNHSLTSNNENGSFMIYGYFHP